MRRRNFIGAIGAVAAICPLAAWPQRALPMIGFLSVDGNQPLVPAFRKGLADAGFVEGRNVAIEYRWADAGRYDLLPAMAKDLVGRKATVLFAGPIAAALAAKEATRTTPIVFVIGSDPVEMGLVASLSRPGGNATGATWLTVELGAKRLGLLRELSPKITSVALLVNPNNPTTATQTKDMQTAAAALGSQLHVVSAAAPGEFHEAFAKLTRQRADALVVSADSIFRAGGRELAALAARHSIPTIYSSREPVAAGGLVSYSSDFADSFRQAGGYVGRILKGERPADLPVIQPTKFELVINLKTAKALGLKVSRDLLARADELIQ
jgi:putative ABC transport system substrate-binding protein